MVTVIGPNGAGKSTFFDLITGRAKPDKGKLDFGSDPAASHDLTGLNEYEINLFKMKLEKAPSDTSARLELGIRLVKADRTDEAIVELQQARKDEKMKGRSAQHLGHAFIKKNNWKLAQRNFEDALAALPESDEDSRKDVLFQLAVGAEKNGDKPRALELGHELANIDYSYNDIGNLIDRWEGRTGG